MEQTFKLGDIIKDVQEDIFIDYDDIPKRNYKPITTGLSDLDNMLGLYNQDLNLIVIAGRPAMGISSLALNIATNIAMNDKLPVLYFSFDASKEQVTQRIISLLSGVSMHHLTVGYLHKDYIKKVEEAIEKLNNVPFYINDSSILTTYQIGEEINKTISQYSQSNDINSLSFNSQSNVNFKIPKLGAVFIDYIELIENYDNNGKIIENIKIINDLKKIASDLEIKIFLLTGIKDVVNERDDHRPGLKDLIDGYSLRAYADIIMMVYKDCYYNHESEDNNKMAEIIIAKNKNGFIGTVELNFDCLTGSFSDRNDQSED